MEKIIPEIDWTKEQDFVCLAGDHLTGTKFPIFSSGIRITQFRPTVTIPQGRLPDIPSWAIAYRIEFECAGVGAPAFFAEFMKLAEKYNHFEESVYLPPAQPAKRLTVWQRIRRLFGFFRRRS